MIVIDKQLRVFQFTKSNVNRNFSVLQILKFIWCLNLYIMVYKYFFLQERQKPNLRRAPSAFCKNTTRLCRMKKFMTEQKNIIKICYCRSHLVLRSMFVYVHK